MNNPSLRQGVEELLDVWTNDRKQAKNAINCIVDWLEADVYWLKANISEYDRDRLKEIAGVL